jgi:hypothetical protein
MVRKLHAASQSICSGTLTRPAERLSPPYFAGGCDCHGDVARETMLSGLYSRAIIFCSARWVESMGSGGTERVCVSAVKLAVLLVH